MIPAQSDYTPQIADRYQRLAGPFDAAAEPLFDGLRGYLTDSGARIVTVAESSGVFVWRLRSECETFAETEQRLARQRRKRAMGNGH